MARSRRKKDDELLESVMTAEAVPVEEKAEEVKMASTFGVVTNCLLLNVRKEPDLKAEVLFTMSALTEPKIDLENSTKDWYKVSFEGNEGFCLKKYITLK